MQQVVYFLCRFTNQKHLIGKNKMQKESATGLGLTTLREEFFAGINSRTSFTDVSWELIFAISDLPRILQESILAYATSTKIFRELNFEVALRKHSLNDLILWF